MAALKTVRLEYYGPLRELCGGAEETLATEAPSAEALFEEIRVRHGLHYDFASLRVAINDEFRSSDAPIEEGDRVVFIPPVSGG